MCRARTPRAETERIDFPLLCVGANVADGAQDQDAVTVAQLKKSIDETVRQVNASITSTTTTGVYYDTVTTGQGESITLKKASGTATLCSPIVCGFRS